MTKLATRTDYDNPNNYDLTTRSRSELNTEYVYIKGTFDFVEIKVIAIFKEH